MNYWVRYDAVLLFMEMLAAGLYAESSSLLVPRLSFLSRAGILAGVYGVLMLLRLAGLSGSGYAAVFLLGHVAFLAVSYRVMAGFQGRKTIVLLLGTLTSWLMTGLGFYWFLILRISSRIGYFFFGIYACKWTVIVVKTIVQGITSGQESLIVKNPKRKRLPWLMLLSLTGAALSLSALASIFGLSLRNAGGYWKYALGIALLFNQGLLIIIAIRFSWVRRQAEGERVILQESVFGYQERAEKLRREQESFAHDFRNQLMVLQTMVEQQSDHKMALEEMIVRLKEAEVLQDLSLSGNLFLDNLLLKKQEECSHRGIHMRIGTEQAELGALPPEEIISLFGNLLDNAIESAERSREKTVQFALEKSGEDSVLIHVVNSCDERPRITESGSWLSRKKEYQDAGIGMRNIRRIVERREGEFAWQYDETRSRFLVTVLLKNAG